MRFKKKIPVQLARVEERIVDAGVTCDLCNLPLDHVKEQRRYDASEVTIGAVLGSVYPDDSDLRRHEADVCRTCFTSKVVPALAAIGLVFRVRAEHGNDDGRVWKEPSDALVAAATAIDNFAVSARAFAFTTEEIDAARDSILGRRAARR